MAARFARWWNAEEENRDGLPRAVAELGHRNFNRFRKAEENRLGTARRFLSARSCLQAWCFVPRQCCAPSLTMALSAGHNSRRSHRRRAHTPDGARMSLPVHRDLTTSPTVPAESFLLLAPACLKLITTGESCRLGRSSPAADDTKPFCAEETRVWYFSAARTEPSRLPYAARVRMRPQTRT